VRVELLWDTQGYGRGNTDVDLHLHRPVTTTDWFDDTDDGYFVNCKSDAHPSDATEWGYESTTETEVCDEAETDSRSIDFCAPENINMDNPAPGDTFRIMVPSPSCPRAGARASTTATTSSPSTRRCLARSTGAQVQCG
jgi:hypothetical protein